MSQVNVEAEPEEVGFDSNRLANIGRLLSTYVEDGKLAGCSALVSRDSKIVYLSTHGMADREAQRTVNVDTLFRIYSMTKPVTSVAAMMLYEEGAFELSDPISKFIPSFSDMRIYRSGAPSSPLTTPASEPIRMWHLLTHTSGMSYGFIYGSTVEAIYRARGYEWGWPAGMSLAETCDAYADMPLLFEPGTEWNYSVATDVLGRIIEVISGQSLDEFFHERILGPLHMDDTSFWVETEDHDRLAALYTPSSTGDRASRLDAFGDAAKSRPSLFSGGGGLISTIGDYHRFTQMLLHAGALDGVRLLGPRTVTFMTQNHLPGGADIFSGGRPLFSETPVKGIGFGLGFSVVIDPVASKILSSPGQFAWGGAASTGFWVDPKEGITVVFMTQLLPSSTYPVRTQLQQLVYQALIE